MNPFDLGDTERASVVVRIIGDNLILSQHNKKIENIIKKVGDAKGDFSKRYTRPVHEITGLLIIAQVLDKDDPSIEHTYHVQLGAPVKFAKDGTISESHILDGFEVPVA